MNPVILLPGLLILLEVATPTKFHSFLTYLLVITRHHPEMPDYFRFRAIPLWSNKQAMLNWVYNWLQIPRWTGAAQLWQKPYLWGPYVWSLVHGVALLDDSPFFYRWLQLLPGVLPCAVCADGFNSILHALPRTYTSSSALAMRLHEAVNHKLNKPNTLSYPIATETWPAALDRQHLLNTLPLDQIPVPAHAPHPSPSPPSKKNRSHPINCPCRSVLR
jgi:hypothetical protein